MKKWNPFRILLAIAVAAVATIVMLVTGFHLWQRWSAVEYRSYASPNGGRFKLVVYAMPVLIAGPGQGSDAPGFVHLYDTSNGKVLYQKDVDMIQNIRQFKWSKTNIYIPLFADWALPP
jgi:hypothetical protein